MRLNNVDLPAFCSPASATRAAQASAMDERARTIARRSSATASSRGSPRTPRSHSSKSCCRCSSASATCSRLTARQSSSSAARIRGSTRPPNATATASTTAGPPCACTSSPRGPRSTTSTSSTNPDGSVKTARWGRPSADGTNAAPLRVASIASTRGRSEGSAQNTATPPGPRGVRSSNATPLPADASLRGRGPAPGAGEGDHGAGSPRHGRQ